MSSPNSPLKTADGIPLKISLRRAERAQKIKSFLFIVPTLVFIIVAFLIPIADMLIRSAYTPVVADLLPKTIKVLDAWDGTDLPDESTYHALAQEMVLLKKQRTLGKVSLLMNYEKSGMRSLVQKTARKMARIQAGPFKEKMIEFDGLSREGIAGMMIKSWRGKEQRKESMIPVTDLEKKKARER